MPSYLAIPGITGDSVAAHHESEIEIDTWSFSCSLATGAFGTGARANRPDLTALTLTCRSGSASPRLLEYYNNPVHAMYNSFQVDPNGTTATQWMAQWAAEKIDAAPTPPHS